MTDFTVALTDLFRKGSVGNPSVFCEDVRILAQGFMELDAAETIRAQSLRAFR